MDYLENTLREECDGKSAISLDTIRSVRLDKLLEDLLSRENRATPTPIQFRADVATAASLQRHWRGRFRADYFEIERLRYVNLPKIGRLRGVVFDDSAKDERTRWRTRTRQQLSELEGELHFEPGQ